MNLALRTSLLAVMLLATSIAAAARPERLLADFQTGTVILASSRHHCLRINAWFADSRKQQAQGLMFIEKLEAFEGMLFRYRQRATINMWMKNTYIPLDMLFIRANGEVARVEANTEPLSERRISSGEPVTRVLELPAGFAASWGLDTRSRLLLAER
ncbi:MAG: DUF192 domain-containing protein [Gammaproteobacteria bacterium]|nr:DUF192 domain-containing protein [Gammaproteobacteria bacterium]